jgi:hypothetical protein
MRDDLWSIVAESQRSRLNPEQLVRLLFRKEITPEDFADRIRGLGFTQEQDADELRKLGINLPGPQDVVRFMMRDVSDGNIVAKFGLDDDFTKKYQGLTKEFADSAGVTADAMRLYWRAHWSIPSPTQLYEMLHRLGNLPDGDANRVTLDDVKTALQQQDILPFWVDKLLAVSYRPLRLVDTQRAYRDGSIDRDEVTRVYRDLGYVERDAQILTRHQERQKLLAGLRLPSAKAYMTGGVPFRVWSEELSQYGYDDVAQQSLRQVALARMRQWKTASCTKSIRRRLLRGEWDSTDGQVQLMRLGLDQDQAQILAEGWACERAAKGKEFSGSQLCSMYSDGLIDGPEMVQRLVRSGWEREDAVKLFSLCSNSTERRRRKEELAQLRRDEAAAEKQRKDAESAQRRLLAEEEKRKAQGERLQKLEQQRRKVLVDAGANWTRRFETDLSESIDAAKRIYRAIAESTTVPKDDIIKSVHVASRAKTVETEDQWLTEALAIAQGAERPETT